MGTAAAASARPAPFPAGRAHNRVVREKPVPRLARPAIGRRGAWLRSARSGHRSGSHRGITRNEPNTSAIHILVKPTRADLITNLVINTDRRTYHLELRSTEKTYMASVSWAYAEDQLIALRRQNAAAEAAMPVATGVDINALNFRYRIEGDDPAWRPLRAFDDGRQVFIEFPAGIGQGEMPPLWVIGAAGGAELVNYRVQGNHMIVDRLFAAAELRLGGEHQKKVRIVRTDGVRSGPLSWMRSSGGASQATNAWSDSGGQQS